MIWHRVLSLLSTVNALVVTTIEWFIGPKRCQYLEICWQIMCASQVLCLASFVLSLSWCFTINMATIWRPSALNSTPLQLHWFTCPAQLKKPSQNPVFKHFWGRGYTVSLFCPSIWFVQITRCYFVVLSWWMVHSHWWKLTPGSLILMRLLSISFTALMALMQWPWNRRKTHSHNSSSSRAVI